jgi:hypothetical protein
MASSVQRSKDDAIMVVYRVKRVVYNSWYTHHVHAQTLISSDADVGHQMLGVGISHVLMSKSIDALNS